MPDDQHPSPPGGDEPARPSGSEEGTYTQKFSHSPVSARVPERVGKGSFCTGIVVQDGPNEFVLDLLQALGRPPQIVGRIVISPPTMGSLVNSLRENLNIYSRSFGPPAPLPKPPSNHRPSIQELYENFKLPEELLSGVYANSFLIAHGPAEFVVDFITGFYPTAAVACRAYLSAQQIPRVLDTLASSFQQHQQRFGGPFPQPPQPPQQPG
ncbi:MAG: hypothetical protein JWO87_3009 [Phycisphaerales bacterium]|jgi:hypothetical protein|nr:hypothetical protein [Phycisphaerales bacterium]MDB5305497.1 hypothetical protein [Phycisphaerales bacterium]